MKFNNDRCFARYNPDVRFLSRNMSLSVPENAYMSLAVIIPCNVFKL